VVELEVALVEVDLLAREKPTGPQKINIPRYSTRV